MKTKAFSLVELSIVLVILGLLTGGILSGQSLIRAAEIRAVSTEYGKFTSALYTFRDKYFAIPGDMSNATSFWGSSGSVCTSAGSAPSSGTCDGNGDGAILMAPAASQSGEIFQFWRQLALAGLVEGAYTGIAGPTPNGGYGWDSIPGTNVPKSKVSNAAWSTRAGLPTAGNTTYSGIDYGNVFQFGSQARPDTPIGVALKPEEAWNIDTKLDDGKPSTGKMVTNYSANCTTTSSQTDLTGSYKLSDTGLDCFAIFVKAY